MRTHSGFHCFEETVGGVLWLGATDTSTEGSFIWTTSGLPLTFTDWFDFEPNGGTVENCIGLYEVQAGLWIDLPCEDAKRGICEFTVG